MANAASILTIAVCLFHGLAAAVAFIGIYGVEIHNGCFYSFGQVDFDQFMHTGALCQAPFWFTALIQTTMGWAVQVAFCSLAVVIVNHWLIGFLLCCVDVLYALFCMAITASFIALDIPVRPYVWMVAASFSFALAEAILCLRASRRCQDSVAMRRALHLPSSPSTPLVDPDGPGGS